MITKKLSLILLFLLYSLLGLQAQKEVVNQSLYWVRYYNQLQINERFAWHNEAEIRRFWEGNTQQQFIAHTRLYYRIGQSTNVGFGFTYSSQSPQDPASTSNLVVPEYRIVQEFNYSIPLSPRLSIRQRLRIDERFIRCNDGEELLDGFNFNFRFRFHVQANYILSKENATKRTTLKVSNEIMFNAGKNIVLNQFDQNRAYIGVERDLSKSFSVEVGYMKWYQQTAAGNVFFNRDIVRVTLFHKLKI